MILRFNKHSIVKKLYDKRKQFSNVKFHPSITKLRTRTLKTCNEMISEEGTIFNKKLNFTFADIEGNLKVCLKQPPRGRNIHTFIDEDNIYELLREQEYNEQGTD